MARVPETALTLISGAVVLTLYEWNTLRAKHYFCSKCGVYVFHRKRAAPDHYGVNAFNLSGLDPTKLPHRATGGKNMTIEDPRARPEWPGPRTFP